MCEKDAVGLFTDDAFCDKIFRENLSLIRYIINQILADKNHVEDIVQETFMEAWAKVSQLRDHPNIKGWLIIAAKNKSMSFNRMKSKKHEELLSEVHIANTDTDMNRIDILSSLKQSDRKLIALYYIERLSIREIAEELDIKDSAVKVRLCRARKRLGKIIRKEDRNFID